MKAGESYNGPALEWYNVIYSQKYYELASYYELAFN